MFLPYFSLIGKDAAKVCRNLMAVDPNNLQFTLVALAAEDWTETDLEDSWAQFDFDFLHDVFLAYIIEDSSQFNKTSAFVLNGLNRLNHFNFAVSIWFHNFHFHLDSVDHRSNLLALTLIGSFSLDCNFI